MPDFDVVPALFVFDPEELTGDTPWIYPTKPTGPLRGPEDDSHPVPGELNTRFVDNE